MADIELQIITVSQATDVPFSLQLLGNESNLYISRTMIGLANRSHCLLYPISLKDQLAGFIGDETKTKYITHPLAEITELMQPYPIAGCVNIYEHIMNNNQRIYVRDLKRSIYKSARVFKQEEDLISDILKLMAMTLRNLVIKPKYTNIQKFEKKRDYYMRLLNFFTVTLAEHGPTAYKKLVKLYKGPQLPSDIPGYVLNYFIKTGTLVQDRKTSIVYIPEQYQNRTEDVW